MEAENAELKKADAVYKYTQEYNHKTEQRYKDEITSLKRQLSSTVQGRDYETELIKNKIDQLREAEQVSVFYDKITSLKNV